MALIVLLFSSVVDEYEKFISEHDCLVKHSGSAGSMEAIGIVECFQSSVKDRKL